MKDSITRGGYNQYGHNPSIQSETATNGKAVVQKKSKPSTQLQSAKLNNIAQPKEDPISKFHALKDARGKADAPAASTTSSVVQRKIMIGDEAYNPLEGDHEKVTHAAADEFLRFYNNKSQMADHLVNNTPSSFGLIKQRALWYDLPYLPHTFFVLGESHAGVTGLDIKEASNLDKPVFYEAHTGWNVKDQNKPYEDGNHGPDENSSKLLRAIQIWDPLTLLPPKVSTTDSNVGSTSGPTAPDLPKIPHGKKSTRMTEDGSYRLVIKGEDGKEQLWKEKGTTEAPSNNYNANDQATDAIKELMTKVFPDEMEMIDIDGNFWTAWKYLRDKTYLNSKPEELERVLTRIRLYLLNGVMKKVKGEYKKLDKAPGSGLKESDDASLKTANDYRDEFMLAAILKASQSGKFSFAAIGQNHLDAIHERLTANGIKVITISDFYGTYSKDAVDIPDPTTI